MTQSGRGDASARVVYLLMIVAGTAVFVTTIAWPTTAILFRWVSEKSPPESVELFSSRQLILLVRTTGLAAIAAIVAHAIALAALFLRTTSLPLRTGSITLMAVAAVLACPPFAYAVGWDQLLPVGIGGNIRCVWTWALWSWPLPALIVGAGWSRLSTGPFEAARLDSGSLGAVCRVVLPALRPHLTFSFLTVFVFLLNEYSVPHACGLQVFSTELLGQISSSSRLVDVLGPSLLPVAVTGVSLALTFAAWRRVADGVDGGIGSVLPGGRATSGSAALTAILLLTWVVPLSGLVLRMGSADPIALALDPYGKDIAITLLMAQGAGTLTVLMGVGVTGKSSAGRLCVVWALAFGALPGALIGAALIAAYNVEAAAPLFDHWPIILTGHVARFGWLGVLSGLVLGRIFPVTILDQAQLDGASWASTFMRIRLPGDGPYLVAIAFIVAVLSVGDIATTSLLRVPDFSPVALIIVEKFHRFEDGLLGALCLILVGAGVAGAVVVGGAYRFARPRR